MTFDAGRAEGEYERNARACQRAMYVTLQSRPHRVQLCRTLAGLPSGDWRDPLAALERRYEECVIQS